MPTLVPDPSEYYNRHDSANFSRSYTDLNDQERGLQSYPSDQSTILLPATTYNQQPWPHRPQPRTPSVPHSLSRIDTSVSQTTHHNRDADQPISANPDDFYRVTLTPPALHQDALRATTVRPRGQSFTDANRKYESNWEAEQPAVQPRRDDVRSRSTPGLKGRKSSVKNLVAQINASSVENPPPLPTQHHASSLPIRNTNPPISMYQIGSNQTGHAHLQNPDLRSDSQVRHSMGGPEVSRSNHTQAPRIQNGQHKRPLFGEVSSNPASLHPAGYGILNARRRAGSESSPMHSPNPMFPPEQRESQFILPTSTYRSSRQRPEHRRTNSDLPRSSYQDDTFMGQGSLFASPDSETNTPVASRIPVVNSRLSTTSETGGSTPNSRTTSALDKRIGKTESGINPTRNRSPKSSLATGKTSRGKITSPSRRSNTSNTAQGPSPSNAKNASLRANIIAPPPKISPPLRSSRPRLPVSNASTAASRARMAEKFNAMQKLNNEKRTSQRRPSKPPELTDVDLKARRLRITQALTRSREGEDLKGNFQTGRRWEPSRSQTSSPQLGTDVPANLSSSIPELRVADVDGDDQSDTHERGDPFTLHDQDQDEDLAAHHNLRTMHYGGSTDSVVMDSPTIGRNESTGKPTMHLQTQFSRRNSRDELPSAITVATEATDIDPEPQEHTRPSLLSHVLELRDRSPSDQYDVSSQIDDDRGDRADVESVNLIFRDTTYLDDDEALRKGYITNFANTSPLPEADEDDARHRDSWSSLVHNEMDDVNEDVVPQEEQMHIALDVKEDPKDHLHDSVYQGREDSYRETMASDAYTIINIVLQEHSSSGIVDQQLADDVYQKVLEACPEAEDEAYYDSQKIEELCLEEMNRRDGSEYFGFTDTTLAEPDATHSAPQPIHLDDCIDQDHDQATPHESYAKTDILLALPPITYRGHRYKSSLDSAEDWADASPSVADWARFASDQDTPSDESQTGEPTPEEENVTATQSQFHTGISYNNQIEHTTSNTIGPLVPLDPDEDVGPEEFGTAIIRAPSRSPPPPPKDHLPSIEQASVLADRQSTESALKRPTVPHRNTSLALGQSLSRPASTKLQTDSSAFETHDQSGQSVTPEIRKFRRRRNVLKELVDTECTYQKDMQIICDIYKPTAPGSLTEEDIRILFGNIEQVSKFAKDFFTALKQNAKPSYYTDRADRKKDKNDGADGLVRNSSSSTLASAKVEDDANDLQRDVDTRVGDAFEGALADMEIVYGEYIRNRHAANQKLEALQKSSEAQKWLKECWDNSSDITQAWNLDALLVKPVQRITKYPLLLKELIDATADEHPDLPTLKRAMTSVTDINMRINEVKKHAEMLDQVLNRKRGQSDVRTGLSKAFGRRAEKLRQHVGITDMYEDPEYDKLRIDYDNNYVQLMVVSNDCSKYERGITHWVNRMVDMAAAMEAWVDVGHSHHQQEESKLRHLAQIIRNVNSIALPDHIDHLRKKVVLPMTKTVDILTKFKDDPKGLLAKRDKRLVDYAQMKNKKDRGEKVDRKMAERMDQWEALNTEAKERIRKLLRATGHLVQTCQGHLIQLQMTWMAMIQQKFSSVMGISLKHLSTEEIERDWQGNFDYQEASALVLGICNGSLMMQAANMTSFLSPGSTTLNGDDSPRQVSFSSTYKRSVSLHSESSNVASMEFGSRPGETYPSHVTPEHQFSRPYSYTNGRNRAASITSGKSARNQEASSRSSSHAKHIPGTANFSRPGTSPGVPQEVFVPPRLSVETHTPLLSEFQVQNLPERPTSTSTFFSAPAGPSYLQGGLRSAGLSVFSSALPMSDSPTVERHHMDMPDSEPQVLFTAASVYEFNIDRARREAGFPYLTYVTGEIFDVIGERGELWLAKNQDDPQKQIGWIWNKHFAKLAE